MEHRSFRGSVEVRQGANGPMICGYAAVFNADSADMGFVEQVDPAAFNRTITQADVRGLGNHDPNWLLGRGKSGTMRLKVDGHGLWYEIDVNEADPDGQRALAKVRRGDWDGSSFSFSTVRDEWNWQAQPPQRRLLEVALIDVGPVTFPAYPDATATSRALEPIAAKVGRPVEELVTALKTGEIRSLINGGSGMEARAVSGTTDLPLSDRTMAWNAAAAQQRVAKWASSDSSGDKDKIDWGKYRTAFFWYDDTGDDGGANFNDYKLQFADVSGNDLVAVWRGVAAVAAVLQGSRGGVDIPAGDVAGVKAKVASYYADARKKYGDNTIQVPWQEGNSLRALNPETGTVMWSSEDGFCDLISDVNDELAGIDSGMCCLDASIHLDKVLIYDWAGGAYYVAGIIIDQMEEPHLDPEAEWVQVEQGWLAASEGGVGGRAFGLLAEMRAGKVISAKNLDALQAAHDSLMDAAKGLRDLIDVAKTNAPADSEVGKAADDSEEDGGGRSLSLMAAQIELRHRIAIAEAA